MVFEIIYIYNCSHVARLVRSVLFESPSNVEKCVKSFRTWVKGNPSLRQIMLADFLVASVTSKMYQTVGNHDKLFGWLLPTRGRLLLELCPLALKRKVVRTILATFLGVVVQRFVSGWLPSSVCFAHMHTSERAVLKLMVAVAKLVRLAHDTARLAIL